MRLRDEGLSRQTLDDEIVLLDLHTSMYLTARSTGALLLRLLESDTDRSTLVHSLLERYPSTPPEIVAADVDAFLATLSERGLLIEES